MILKHILESDLVKNCKISVCDQVKQYVRVLSEQLDKHAPTITKQAIKHRQAAFSLIRATVCRSVLTNYFANVEICSLDLSLFRPIKKCAMKGIFRSRYSSSKYSSASQV